MNLDGMRVLLTRSPDRASGMADAITAAGGAVQLLPLLDFQKVDFSVQELASGSFDWLVISSITTVRALKESSAVPLKELIPAGTRVATIGPSSRRILEAEGVRVDLAPEGEQSAQGLVEMLQQVPGLNGTKVWLPQSDLAGGALAEGWRAAGASVQVTTAYLTVDYPAKPRLTAELLAGNSAESNAPLLSLDQARAAVHSAGLDAVVAASPSAAERIAARLAPLGSVALVAIGGPTARAAESLGLRVAVIAPSPTPEGIVVALAEAKNSINTSSSGERL